MWEKRYNENFTTFLQEHKIHIIVENDQEKCLIADDPLDVFLQKEENQSKHDFIRQNIHTATLNFDHRVKAFINDIVMNKESPFSVKYYNYRVEFQLRGAAHIHGTIWIDADKFLKEF